MDIFTSLIQIRKEKKIEQYSIAKHLKISNTTLSRYENGKREIPMKLLYKYAEFLGYEIRLLKK